MNQKRTSLLRGLFKSLLLPGVVVALVGVAIVYALVKEEYDELQDISLISKAHLLLNATSHLNAADAFGASSLLQFEETYMEQEERSAFWLLDDQFRVVVQSKGADPSLIPDVLVDGMLTQNNHRFAVVSGGLYEQRTIIVATPMGERNEAIRDVLTGVLLGFILLGLLFAATAFWAARRSVRIISDLSANIAQKNENDLSPINRKNSFVEIQPAIDTLDTLMARLNVALAAERAFATNAAHELRTPVAICLANVQRLRSQLTDTDLLVGTDEIEGGLKRLVRIIERLLQMSRAQSGLGLNTDQTDINPVISLLLNEMRDREPSHVRLVITGPSGTHLSWVDQDALGIILNNLLDNALKYASGPMPTVVDASEPSRVLISNDCDRLRSSELEVIKRRFARKATTSEGFGLGLSIVQQLCDQSGCKLELSSPLQDKERGFVAVLTLPSGAKPQI